MRVWLALLALSLPLLAQEGGRTRARGEFWNWFFWEAVDTGKFRVRGVVQLRSQPQKDTYLRSQGGPILEWQQTKNWNFLIGYYFQEFRGSFLDPEMQGAHRPFGGVEYAFSKQGLSNEVRILYEYFKSLNGRDSARTRTRYRMEFPGPLGPFAQQEFFLDGQGIQASRSEAGITYGIAKNLEIQLTYFHEYRPERSGGTRDVLNTRITFEGPWKKR